MDKLYERINWKNLPDKTTPLGATNLNKMDAAIDALDDRVVSLAETQGSGGSDSSIVESYIVSGAARYSSGWLSSSNGGKAHLPVKNKLYIIMSSGEYARQSYIWNGEYYIRVSDKMNYLNIDEYIDHPYAYNKFGRGGGTRTVCQFNISDNTTSINVNIPWVKMSVTSSTWIEINGVRVWVVYGQTNGSGSYSPTINVDITQRGGVFKLSYSSQTFDQNYINAGNVREVISNDGSGYVDEFLPKNIWADSQSGLLPAAPVNAEGNLQVFLDDGQWHDITTVFSGGGGSSSDSPVDQQDVDDMLNDVFS